MNRIIMVFIVLLFANLASAQSNSDKVLKKKIVGTWQFHKMEFILTDKATEEEKAAASMADGMSGIMSSFQLKFKQNGSYEQSQEDVVTKGTYAIQNGTIVFLDEAGENKDEGETFISIDNNILTLSSKTTEGISGKILLKRKGK